jgi:hypothetical protein
MILHFSQIFFTDGFTFILLQASFRLPIRAILLLYHLSRRLHRGNLKKTQKIRTKIASTSRTSSALGNSYLNR